MQSHAIIFSLSPAFLSQLPIITCFPLVTPPFWLATATTLHLFIGFCLLSLDIVIAACGKTDGYTLLGGVVNLVGQLLNADCKIHSHQRDLDGYVELGQGSANRYKKRAPFHSGNDSALYVLLKNKQYSVMTKQVKSGEKYRLIFRHRGPLERVIAAHDGLP